jgi:hypothetical protein
VTQGMAFLVIWAVMGLVTLVAGIYFLV